MIYVFNDLCVVSLICFVMFVKWFNRHMKLPRIAKIIWGMMAVWGAVYTMYYNIMY